MNTTALASDPQANVAFYMRVLGLRLVKKTVNFDEKPEELGTRLKLPPWFEAKREAIERVLPPLVTMRVTSKVLFPAEHP